MVRIDLEKHEAEMLRAILESYLSDLRMEIADTDSQEFREQLKRQKTFLRDLTLRLAA